MNRRVLFVGCSSAEAVGTDGMRDTVPALILVCISLTCGTIIATQKQVAGQNPARTIDWKKEEGTDYLERVQ